MHSKPESGGLGIVVLLGQDIRKIIKTRKDNILGLSSSLFGVLDITMISCGVKPMRKSMLEKIRWLGFSQIVILYILENMDAYLLVPNYNLIKHELGVSDTYLGFLMGGYLLMNGLAAFLWSYVSDTRGMKRKALLATSFGAGGFFTILASISPNPIPLMFFWILAGGSLGAIIPLGFSLISDLFDRRMRTRAFMLWYMLGGIGLAVGYIVALFLGAYYGWRFPLYVGGIILMVFGAPLCLSIWEPQRGISDVEAHIDEYYYPYRFRPQDVRLILSNKSNIYVALQGFFGTIPNGVLFTWTVHYIIREAHASEVAASVFLGLMSTGALGGLFLSYLADKLYERDVVYRPLIAASCSIGEGVLFMIFFAIPIKLNIYTDNPKEAFLMMIDLLSRDMLVLFTFTIFFIAMFLNSPVGAIRNSILADVNLPEDKATVLSAINIAELLSKSIGITVVGFLSDILGSLRIPIIIAMSIWILSGISWIYVARYYHGDLAQIKNILEQRLKSIGVS